MTTYRIQDLPLASTPLDGLADAVEVIQSGVNRKTPVNALWRPLGTASDEACAGDDARLSDSRLPLGAAGGDLSGTYPNPDVVKVVGVVPTATGLNVLGAVDEAAARTAIGVEYGPAVDGRVALRDAVNGLTNSADLSVTVNGGVPVLALNGYARLSALAFPGSPVEGEIVNAVANKCLRAFIGGMTQFDRRAIATQVADVVNTATVDTAIIGASGVGTLVIPANYLTVGKTFDIDIRGSVTTIGANGTLKVKLGTAVLATLGPFAVVPATALQFRLTVRIACSGVGPTGQVRATGTLVFNDAVTVVGFHAINPNASGVTVDTTASAALDVTWAWSIPGNSFRSCLATVEVSA